MALGLLFFVDGRFSKCIRKIYSCEKICSFAVLLPVCVKAQLLSKG